MPIIIRVKTIEYSHYHCVCVPLLEFWCLLKKFKSWMIPEQVFEHRLKVFVYNCVGPFLRYNIKQS